MKVNYPAKVGFRIVLLAIIILVSSTFSSTYGESREITLLVQQTPNEGGHVTPLSGNHKYEQNTEVTLTATPNAGYRFLHWLGDVSDKESVRTTVRLDKPKIVIAVFEPVKDRIGSSKGYVSAGGGSGGSSSNSSSLVRNHVAIGNSVSVGGGGGGSRSPEPVVHVPAGENNPAVPEPATGILLTLGSIFALAKRRRKEINPSRI